MIEKMKTLALFVFVFALLYIFFPPSHTPDHSSPASTRSPSVSYTVSTAPTLHHAADLCGRSITHRYIDYMSAEIKDGNRVEVDVHLDWSHSDSFNPRHCADYMIQFCSMMYQRTDVSSVGIKFNADFVDKYGNPVTGSTAYALYMQLERPTAEKCNFAYLDSIAYLDPQKIIDLMDKKVIHKTIRKGLDDIASGK